jgi:hypothetical protein
MDLKDHPVSILLGHLALGRITENLSLLERGHYLDITRLNCRV